ncbi:hypothetical protein SAMN04487859_10771 [Roseovarius lutimaris]|uniref:Uncharacterized protein n=1 Tax=Roseovarius lutimaris TaxID=1005928 RepID=A0A1I5B5G3_9RHOB|nr:hypothetical protein [Roseovarius lutimaris]SFN69934.1 hypothetical protein SAMN04487859_10771 [Roseovarius lutimaris]
MVEIADIDSLGRLEAWLNGQSHEVAVCIAPRAAAWVLPIWWHAVLSEDWARGREWTALTVLRCTLISYVAAKMPNEDIKRVASNAAATARTSASLASGAATHAAAAHAAFSAAFAASTAFSDEPVNTAFNAFAASINSASTAAAGSNNHSYSVSDPSTPAFAIWQSFRADASQMKDEEILVFTPLWQQGVGPFDGLWEKINGFVEGGDSPHDWQFWIEWYQALLDGRPMLGNAARTWEMLEKIALIDPKDWDQGPEVVNPVINGIWGKYKSIPDPDKSLNEMLADQPDATKVRIHEVRQVMDRAKRDLPPTFDAILGLILLELERLQHKNYESELEQLEGKRQISVFLTLYEAVERMQALLPNENPATTADAEEMEGLLRLYFDRFRGLCREKVDDVANGVWSTGAGVVQGGLILGSASLATTFGLPAMAGVAVGSLVFAPDRAGQIIKVAKETITKQV